MESLTVSGKLESLDTVSRYVMDAATSAGLNKKVAYRLRLAVDEILTNIVVHGYEENNLSGDVIVRAQLDDQFLAITLEDTAVPFDPRKLPVPEHIDDPLHERPIGGLGVYLALRDVDAFDYEYVDGRNRNIFLMQREAPSSDVVPSPAGSGGHLLLASTTSNVDENLLTLLRDLGYRVSTASGEQETLRQLQTNQVDLIALHIQTGQMVAEHLLVQLKTNSGLRHIPVLVLIAASQIESAERCITLGADDYLTEPFSLIRLRLRVNFCLEIQRLQTVQQVERERLKFERDIQIGRQIQSDFLPEKLPELAGWEVTARFHAARNVSGDFYDAFPMSRGRIGLVIGDVCDKGVGAALFMSLFRSLIRVLAQQTYSTNLLDSLDDSSVTPAQRVERRRPLPTAGMLALKNAIELTNNYIAHNHYRTSMFATIFFGVLDPATGQLSYINAGHEHPLIVGQDGIKARLTGTGMAVGMMPDVEFGIAQAHLDLGDMLVCYTDGVPDARNPAGKLFGEPRLLGLLRLPESSAVAMLDRIETSVYVHIAGADQFDDITMLAVQRKQLAQA